MKLGMIIPTFPNEKRVALLPEDIKGFENEIIIEKGFGHTLDIPDDAYEETGCRITDRETIFKECDAVFSLKVLQPSDYPLLRKGQMVVGWTHPGESGKPFMDAVGNKQENIIVDLDNIHPMIYIQDKKVAIPWIPRNFVERNSFTAGYSSTIHAFLSYGELPTTTTKVAVLAPGNVSQGAYAAAVKLGAHDIRLFYRKTMNEFLEQVEEFDVIISGIELAEGQEPILTIQDQKRVKKGALIIDAAADAGHTIEGTHYTSIDEPLYKKDGIYYYCVNNSPSVLYRESSKDISKAFSKWVYSRDLQDLFDLSKKVK